MTETARHSTSGDTAADKDVTTDVLLDEHVQTHNATRQEVLKKVYDLRYDSTVKNQNETDTATFQTLKRSAKNPKTCHMLKPTYCL